MRIYCPKHNENHNLEPANAEKLVYYLRRLYIEAAYAAPLVVTPISAGVEYTYNNTCVLSELDDLKNLNVGEDFYAINAAHAISDFNTRRRLDEPLRARNNERRRSSRRKPSHFVPSVRE